MSDLRIFVITSPNRIEDEAGKISLLLESGIENVHIRKPGWSLREVKDLIEDIPYHHRKRLRLHGHFELLNEMNLAGVHLNSRNPKAPYNASSVSVSIHQLSEIDNDNIYDYQTLSPIFDSISKTDYKSKFNPLSLSPYIQGKRIVALGGVTPDKLLQLKSIGFYGAALLGYIWEGVFNNNLENLIKAKNQLSIE